MMPAPAAAENGDSAAVRSAKSTTACCCTALAQIAARLRSLLYRSTLARHPLALPAPVPLRSGLVLSLLQY